MTIRPPDKATWYQLQTLHHAVEEWADAKDNEHIDPISVQTAEARLLLALARLDDTQARQHPSMFDRSWTPFDQDAYDRDEFLTAVERYANEEAS